MLVSLVIRWFGSRYVGTCLALLGVVATFLIGFLLIGTGNPGESNVLVMSFLAGVSFNGMQAFMYAVAAHSYPTEIRGTGVGTAVAVGRIGNVLAVYVGNYAINLGQARGYFLSLAILMALVLISLAIIRRHVPKVEQGRQFAAAGH